MLVLGVKPRVSGWMERWTDRWNNEGGRKEQVDILKGGWLMDVRMDGFWMHDGGMKDG